MSFTHACFDLHSAPVMAHGTAEEERPAGSREDSPQDLRASYAAQAILTATEDLLECAMRAESLDDALELAKAVRLLRERIDAIATRALQRADELCR